MPKQRNREAGHDRDEQIQKHSEHHHPGQRPVPVQEKGDRADHQTDEGAIQQGEGQLFSDQPADVDRGDLSQGRRMGAACSYPNLRCPSGMYFTKIYTLNPI